MDLKSGTGHRPPNRKIRLGFAVGIEQGRLSGGFHWKFAGHNLLQAVENLAAHHTFMNAKSHGEIMYGLVSGDNLFSCWAKICGACGIWLCIFF